MTGGDELPTRYLQFTPGIVTSTLAISAGPGQFNPFDISFNQPLHQEPQLHQVQVQEEYLNNQGQQPERETRRSQEEQEHENTVNDDNEEEDKITLKRNRIAASKCRQKKKQFINDLQERLDAAVDLNNKLKADVERMRGEVSRMKTKVLAHRGCKGCLLVQRYIHSSALFDYSLPQQATVAGSIAINAE